MNVEAKLSVPQEGGGGDWLPGADEEEVDTSFLLLFWQPRGWSQKVSCGESEALRLKCSPPRQRGPGKDLYQVEVSPCLCHLIKPVFLLVSSAYFSGRWHQWQLDVVCVYTWSEPHIVLYILETGAGRAEVQTQPGLRREFSVSLDYPLRP